MKRTIKAILLVLAVSLVGSVWAEIVEVSTWADLKSNLESGKSVKLIADVAQGSFDGEVSLAMADARVTLDLNGYTVALMSRLASLSATETNITFTLTDSIGTGVVTGGSAVDGGCVWIGVGNTFSLDGGTISSCTASGVGGAFYNEGAFTMNGGMITNCVSTDGASLEPSGGGAVYNKGALTMTGGRIVNCSASGFGGALFIKQSSVGVMTGGEIVGCSSRWGGGAVYAKGRFTVYGGSFLGNVSTKQPSWALFGENGATVYGGVSDNEDIGNWRATGKEYVWTGNLYLVGEGIVCTADGKLESGLYTFCPTNAEYVAAGLRIKETVKVRVNATEPKTWTLYIPPILAVPSKIAHASETVYVRGVLSTETYPGSGQWHALSNEIAIVVYTINEANYFFEGGVKTATNALDTSVNPAVNIGPLPDVLYQYEYIDETGARQVTNAYVISTSDSRVTWTASWYVATNDVTLSGGVQVSGAAKLILLDGTKLTISGVGEGGAGIAVFGAGNSFTVYGQANDTGCLEVWGGRFAAGIGGNSSCIGSGITINGGTVTTFGGEYGAGIGGGSNADGTNITVNGGIVTAIGGDCAAGIGGGHNGSGRGVIIHGGIVTARGGGFGSGIGGGNFGGCSDIFITGGKVTASGSTSYTLDYGMGIGTGANPQYGRTMERIYAEDDILVKAGSSANPSAVIPHASNTTDIAPLLAGKRYVTTEQQIPILAEPAQVAHTTMAVYTNGALSAETSPGSGQWYAWKDKPTIVVYTAEKDCFFAGGASVITNVLDSTVDPAVNKTSPPKVLTIQIEYVDENGTAQKVLANLLSASATRVAWSTGWYAVADSDLTITGGADVNGEVKLIVANGANLTVSGVSSHNAGLGVSGAGHSLTVYGQAGDTGVINAVGGYCCAGIGGGEGGAGSTITIHGGTVNATGGERGAGIGGGYLGTGSQITIAGGKVNAFGGSHGAGIGGGRNAGGFDITISGGTVTSTGGQYGAGIGGGYEAAGTDILITGGTVMATGGFQGAGIGGGNAALGANIVITSGTVIAEGGDGYGYAASAIGSGHQGPAASDIYADQEVVVTAGDSPNPTTIIPHEDNTTDLAVLLKRKRYATADSRVIGVEYVDENGVRQTRTAFPVVTSGSRVNWETGWYAVVGHVTLSRGAAVSGAVKLILADGAKLTIDDVAEGQAGVAVSGANDSLTIYGQCVGTGLLDVTGGTRGAGIGGGDQEAGSNIAVYGGMVVATGGEGAAGLGGGAHAPGVGSNICAAVDMVVKAGASADSTTVIPHLSSSTDLASLLADQQYATVLPETIQVSYLDEVGETRWTAAFPILSSDTRVSWEAGWYVVVGQVAMVGGADVTGVVKMILPDAASLTISGVSAGKAGITVSEADAAFTVYGQREATGVLDVTGGAGGAGIGGDNQGVGTNITVYGGTIRATGGTGGAGIGGGSGGAGIVSIGGGTIIATGGIGDGVESSESSTIVITGGNFVDNTVGEDELFHGNVTIYGAVCNRDELGAKMASGKECVQVGELYLVGEDILYDADGKLTGGVYTFCPTNAEYVAAGIAVADNRRSVQKETTPVTWGIEEKERLGITVNGLDLNYDFGAGWTFKDGVLALTNDQAYILAGTNTTGAVRVQVTASAEITLDHFELLSCDDSDAVTFESNATHAVVTLVGDNAVSAMTNALVVMPGAQVTLQGEGALVGGARESCRCVMVNAGGQFIMTNATIRDYAFAGEGGAVYNQGTFTMHGGCFCGNSATSWGYVIRSADGSVLTITGGQIVNNHGVHPGAVSVDGQITGATVTISGGVMMGNSSDDSGTAALGRNIQTCAATDVITGGVFDAEPSVENISVAFGMVTVGQYAHVGEVWIVGDGIAYDNEEKLTGGVYTFCPTNAEYATAGIAVATNVMVTKSGESYTLTATGVIACDSWAQVKGNLLSGNDVKLVSDLAMTSPSEALLLSGNLMSGKSYDVEFDLNGHILTGYDGGGTIGEQGRIFILDSPIAYKLTITDSVGGGGFVGHQMVTGYAGGFALVGGACQLVINHGSIAGFSSSVNGGAIAVTGSAAFVMNGGIITNCTAMQEGGAIYCEGTTTIHGGVFVDNTTGTDATALFGGSGTTTVRGGVSDCSLIGDKKDAGRVCAQVGACFVVGTDVACDANDKLTGGVYTFCPTNAEYVAAGIALASNVTMRCEDANYTLVATAAVEVAEWGQVKANLEVGNDVVLIADVAQTETDSQIELSVANRCVTLDLNGHEVTCYGWGHRLVALTASSAPYASFTLKDSVGGGIVKDGNWQNCGCVWIGLGNTFVMDGGTIYNCAGNDKGGAVYVNNGVFTMNGGTIDSCTNTSASAGGGGVYVSASGVFTMNGGVITNCAAANQGGAVYNLGEFTMNGGTICGNYSPSWGYAVRSYKSAFTMTGGQIVNNYGTTEGALSTDGATVNISGGVMKGNSSSNKGTIAQYRNIQAYCSDVTMAGGVFDAEPSVENIRYVSGTGTFGDYAAVGSNWVVGSDISVSPGDRLLSGTYLFCPTNAEYVAAGLAIEDVSVLQEKETEPKSWTISLPLVLAMPTPIAHTTVAVYTNGIISAETSPGSGLWYGWTNGTETVVYTVEDGYCFAGGAKAVTNSLDMTVNPAVNMDYPSEILAEVEYLDEEGEPQTAAARIVMSSDSRQIWPTDWYVVDSEVSIAKGIQIDGAVNLILADGGVLTIDNVDEDNAGITVSDEGNSLSIYGQAMGTGELNVQGGQYAAGIGGDEDCEGANITINGGRVNAAGGTYAAGIGGGDGGAGVNITINGGTVTANGSYDAAGIGGGDDYAGVNITINGGTVTANGGGDGAGIGGGNCGAGVNITINGGVVTAIGGEDGAGIGGGDESDGTNISINASTVTAIGGMYAAGIGGGYGGAGVNITIIDSKVTAIGNVAAAGIGGGYEGFASGISIDNSSVFVGGGAVNDEGSYWIPQMIGSGADCGKEADSVMISDTAQIFFNLTGLYDYDDEEWIVPMEPMPDSFAGLVVLMPGTLTVDRALVSGVAQWTGGMSFSLTNVVGTTGTVMVNDPDKTDFAGQSFRLRSENNKLFLTTADYLTGVEYVDAGGALRTTNAFAVASSDVSEIWNGGWYVVNGNVTLTAGAQARGKVNLILADDAKLTITCEENSNPGIDVSGEGNSFTIYAQSAGTGELDVAGGYDCAGIGGSSGVGASIVVNGGTVRAIGESGAAGIGGNWSGGGFNIAIRNARVFVGSAVECHENNNYRADLIGDGVEYSDSVGSVTISDAAQIFFNLTGRYDERSETWMEPMAPMPDTVEGMVILMPTSQVQEGILVGGVADWTAGTTFALTNVEGVTGTVMVNDLEGTVFAGQPFNLLCENNMLFLSTAQLLTDVAYVDETGATRTTNAFVIASGDERVSWNAGWYVVTGDVSRSRGASVNGQVSMILADGATLTIQDVPTYFAGIAVGSEGSSLTIYAQGEGTGALTVTGGEYGAGIGGGDDLDKGANITINGGRVTATGGNCAAGIGGSGSRVGENITINGGTVTATGGSWAAGIGGGSDGWGENITINGGTVTATGGYYGDGIGNGAWPEDFSSQIYVATNLVLKAGESANPTEVIPHMDAGQDMASALANLRYVLTDTITVIYPAYLDGCDDDMKAKFSVWAASFGSTDPEGIYTNAFLLNVATNREDEAVAEFKIESIVVTNNIVNIEISKPLEPATFFNGEVWLQCVTNLPAAESDWKDVGNEFPVDGQHGLFLRSRIGLEHVLTPEVSSMELKGMAVIVILQR